MHIKETKYARMENYNAENYNIFRWVQDILIVITNLEDAPNSVDWITFGGGRREGFSRSISSFLFACVIDS